MRINIENVGSSDSFVKKVRLSSEELMKDLKEELSRFEPYETRVFTIRGGRKPIPVDISKPGGKPKKIVLDRIYNASCEFIPDGYIIVLPERKYANAPPAEIKYILLHELLHGLFTECQTNKFPPRTLPISPHLFVDNQTLDFARAKFNKIFPRLPRKGKIFYKRFEQYINMLSDYHVESWICKHYYSGNWVTITEKLIKSNIEGFCATDEIWYRLEEKQRLMSTNGKVAFLSRIVPVGATPITKYFPLLHTGFAKQGEYFYMLDMNLRKNNRWRYARFEYQEKLMKLLRPKKVWFDAKLFFTRIFDWIMFVNEDMQKSQRMTKTGQL